jgi:hypothetical protein
MDNIDNQSNGKPWYYLPKRKFSTLTVEEYIEERIMQFRDGMTQKL